MRSFRGLINELNGRGLKKPNDTQISLGKFIFIIDALEWTVFDVVFLSQIEL